MAANDAVRVRSRPARDNPFAVDRVLRVRYHFAKGSIEELCTRLESANWCGAIVGPHGTGKTTLLEDLADHLRRQGWRVRGARLTTERPSFDRSSLKRLFADAGPRDIIALDGAEQLSRFAWRRFQRRARGAGGLIITSHRAGLLPTIRNATTSLETLNYVVEQLVPAPSHAVRDEAQRLFAEHGGNIRDVIRSLYDAWAQGQIAVEAA
ncbi:MAG: AAA family ATPase [Pirellulales bacterium]|nr:AAA family ATPase [Pirellulales bacterium]